MLDKPHVGINVNNPLSVESALPSYFSSALGGSVSINLLSGEPIQVWVDYDGSLLNVSLFKVRLVSDKVNNTKNGSNRGVY